MAKLGSEQRPAIARVQTLERADEIVDLCDQNGWQVIVGVEPDKTEDISDVERLLNPVTPVVHSTNVGRNDPYPCGSGTKFKKCCAN